MKNLKTFDIFNENNITNNDQSIIDDILSTNESVGSWFEKFINYGKKGLLTAAIVLSVAFSTQAKNQNKTTDVINHGIELLQSSEKKDVYSFFVGIAAESASISMKNGEIESSAGFIELSKHYQSLRDNKIPDKLSKNAIKCFESIKNITKKLDKNDFIHFIQEGKNLHTTTN